ncbi:hypothetical protein [Stieleria marina]|uniref:hypothetical protein n=1 Tax=Stieleria marina TaxID=1930275 RepID=UPI003AF405F8
MYRAQVLPVHPTNHWRRDLLEARDLRIAVPAADTWHPCSIVREGRLLLMQRRGNCD